MRFIINNNVASSSEIQFVLLIRRRKLLVAPSLMGPGLSPEIVSGGVGGQRSSGPVLIS